MSHFFTVRSPLPTLLKRSVSVALSLLALSMVLGALSPATSTTFARVNTFASREQIDRNVQSFEGVTGTTVLVLGLDKKLWGEHPPFGTIPPARDQIDANVLYFQFVPSTNLNPQIVVEGTDSTLWLEHAPFGNVPPARDQIDANVGRFQAISPTQILVEGDDGNLWLEHGPFGTVPPARDWIDGNVLDMRAIDAQQILVRHTDYTLWLETLGSDGTVTRTQIDTNVLSFEPSLNETGVVGSLPDRNSVRDW